MTPSFLSIDFETANEKHDSACAIGLVRVEGGQIVAKEMRLINPDTYFKWFCINVHKLTEKDVADAPYFDEIWQELTPLFQDIEFIVAHNARFDKSVLYKSCDRYNIPQPEQNFSCSIKAAKHLCKLPSYSLDKVCAYLGIELNHHEALSDATACAEIMIMAYEKGYRV